MRRSIVITGLGVGLVASAGMPASAQVEDLQAFCAARVDLEQAMLNESGHEEDQHGSSKSKTESHGFQGDEEHGGDDQGGDEEAGHDNGPSATKAARTLESTAPAAVADDAATVAKAVEDKGAAGLEDEDILAAAQRIDEFVLASCGFPQVDVTGADYEFTGLPEILPTGPVAFSFTNEAPKEQHELVVLRVNDNVKTSAKKLVALSEKKLAKKAELVAAAFAPAGESGVTIGRLEPGRYVVYCSVPVDGLEHGKPHWKEGMITELRAEDGS